jgi:hypothetical protein
MEILRVSQNEKINQVKAIVLTDSVLADTQQLSKNLLQISNILGFMPSKSIVILGTKR